MIEKCYHQNVLYAKNQEFYKKQGGRGLLRGLGIKTPSKHHFFEFIECNSFNVIMF